MYTGVLFEKINRKRESLSCLTVACKQAVHCLEKKTKIVGKAGSSGTDGIMK
jgi:hypothetical protein